jgi:uncharacterized protein (DUF433 family)
VIAAINLLGKGLYSPADAALYARVSPRLMKRWTYGSAPGQSVIDPELGDTEGKTLTFLDFVQTLAIGRLRTDVRLSLQKIRNAYDFAREEFKVDFPFALKSTRFGLFGPPNNLKRQELFVCIGQDDDGTSKYFQLTGKKRGNQLIREVVRTYARHINFDETTDLATKYFPFERGSYRIVMDPAVRFGEPYLESCGYTARTLYDAYRVERSLSRTASMYGVTEQEIELAIDYFDFLKPNAA